MDFDDLEVPSQATTRVSRFAPKSSKLKPKKEPQPVPKEEPREIDLTAEQNEDCIETITPTQMKSEHNGTVKIEAESKSEAEHDSRKVDSVDVEMTEAEKDSTQVNPMDEDNKEDTVVREIDVFFSPSIDDDTKLYVMQYPLRPSWLPYELDERCEEVRLKPDSLDVAVDLSVDLESSTVDREFLNTLKYTKQTLSTTLKPSPANGCAVGLLMGDKLHLHPIHAVVQLRPSRHYLDSGGSEKNNVATSNMQNKRMEPSKSNGDECWVPLKYHGCKSDISSIYFQQMVAHKSFPINFEMSAYDYITALCREVSHNGLTKGPSTRHLLSLPVEKRLETLLIEGPPLHRFSAIKYFAPEYSNEELLSFLQKHALLLQGYWVPRGSLLYPNRGVESLARNYVLVLFHKSLKVRFADVRIWSDRVKHFLKQFALEQVDLKRVKYWKFKELSDESFIKEFPNVVIQQEEIFKILEEEVTKVVYDIGKHKPSKVR